MSNPVKRRVIWFDDNEWAVVLEQSKLLDMTPSAYLRMRVGDSTALMRPTATAIVIGEDELAVAKAARPNAAFLAYNPAPKVRAKR